MMRPIDALEETPLNALAYMFVMSDHVRAEHDQIWQQIHHAVRGVGYFYVDLRDQV
ncbi:MAG: hypothetical protein GTO41_04520, partial [Burkholderiales bacterium]|nr:hypothetical protein [Burkholderiales bacterium]